VTTTWRAAPPVLPAPTGVGRLRVLLRGTALGTILVLGLGTLLLLRLLERPVFGLRRPVTPFVTQAVCRAALGILGLRYTVRGQPLRGAGAVVANHGSWLDIFVLNARKRVYFVAKEDVAGWAGIGWLARATGTVFIRRARGEAARQRDIFRARIAAGHRLLFFPEGTSSDGRRVLPFKPTLFAAFFDPGLGDFAIQPVTVIYTAPPGTDPRVHAWYGDMEFAPHLAAVLGLPRGGGVEVVYHPPLRVADFADRKALAAAAEAAVRAPLDAALSRERCETP
jgi:1-acyl-sn-glycerol-3-phosphate acyltransferase